MNANYPFKRPTLPSTYFEDLEKRVFSELGIEPKRTKEIQLWHSISKWSIAASLILLIGSIGYYTKYRVSTSIEDLKNDQIAGYLSIDYEAERYLDAAINKLGDEFTVGWHEEELTPEAVKDFLIEKDQAYWLNENDRDDK